MNGFEGWVTVPIRGQLDGIGPNNDIDDTGAYPLTISLRRETLPDLLQQLVKAAVTGAADETVPLDHPAVVRMFADQLGRAYDWRRIEELEKEDPDAVARHMEAAEELWPWLAKGNERDRSAAFRRGFAAGKARGEEQARQDNAADSAHIALAVELRIPCPEAADPGRPDGGPVMQPKPLILRKNQTGGPKGWEDGWSIINPNLFPDRQVWTGREWQRDGDLYGNAVYRYTREEAVTEAQRLAPEETRRYEAWLADMRANRGAAVSSDEPWPPQCPAGCKQPLTQYQMHAGGRWHPWCIPGSTVPAPPPPEIVTVHDPEGRL